MLTTNSSILNTMISIEVYSLIITVVFGLVVAISYPLFNKLNKNGVGALLPVYNLFEFCGLNGFKESVGILFLIPGFNIILIMLMSYRLKDSFKTSSAFNLGLLFIPWIYVPVLAYGNISPINEYENDEEKEEKSEEIFEQAEVHDIDVDSIFKTNKQMMEEAKPYRAKKVDVNEEFVNSEPAKAEKIEKIKKN